MQPSSLIFLVIVAIWVAYLIQHWVRRREHLATARSVDKFSEAMRVLERRSPLPTSAPSSSRGSETAVATPTGRPVVAVKHATVSSPLRARATDGAPLGPVHPVHPVHQVPPIELVPHRTFAQILLRRIRGIAAVVTLGAVPVTVVLSAVHVLKWVSVLIAVAGLVLVLGWLRISAIREQAARRARRVRQRDVASRAVTKAGSGSSAGSAGPDAAAQAESDSDSVPAPGSWQPVPVPPPTYSLKDVAHRPEVEPAAVPPAPAWAEDPARPVPIDVEDDDIDALAGAHHRRVVG